MEVYCTELDSHCSQMTSGRSTKLAVKWPLVGLRRIYSYIPITRDHYVIKSMWWALHSPPRPIPPLNPIWYRKKWGLQGYPLFPYVCSKRRLWVLVRTASSRQFSQAATISIYLWTIDKKFHKFSSKNAGHWALKNSIKLHRYVKVMNTLKCFKWIQISRSCTPDKEIRDFSLG